jgi:hypothetical protein
VTARAVLDGIKGRMAEVTNLGEWETTRSNDVVIYAPNGFGAYKLIAHADAKTDATFIAAAPTDVARLTAAIDAVLKECEDMESQPQTELAPVRFCGGLIRAAIENALTP